VGDVEGRRRRGFSLPVLCRRGGLPGDWLTMGCTPTASPSSCDARQGFGWAEDAVERRN
jgi:hypothetical protein